MAYSKRRRTNSSGMAKRLTGAFTWGKKWKNYAMIIAGVVATAFIMGWVALTPKASSTISKATGGAIGGNDQKQRTGSTKI